MIFSKMLYDSGHIQHIEYQIYSKWFECFAKDYPINKVVYVNSSPEICYARIYERSRLGESEIPLDYLTSCDDYHKNMIASFSENKNISVMEIGCGEGILTQAILQGPCKQLKVFEIDPEWASFVKEKYGSDRRLIMIEENVLDEFLISAAQCII